MLLAESFSLIFILIFVGLGFLSNYMLHRMATKPLMREDEPTNPGSFISERAYDNLKALNNFGPKVIGSIANEENAAQFVLDYVNEIKRNSIRPDDVMVDHQLTSGVVRDNAMYFNIQNVVVRLQGESDHAVLMNSHFDSVPGSPGGSDDIVMVCVMMEILRVLSLQPRLRHSIIFLFNGAEEQDLQAAHGFITQHRWANDSRALINLESTGSGGREILFRSGPKHNWLIEMYRKSAPRPFGHAVADELFATGFIPSATDFEIFRDYGNVPGLDFAYVEDGWRYHTRYDNVDYIDHESVQHTGNNILPLTINMANSNELENPPEGSWPIYFDYLGLFMITYKEGVGTALNYTVSILVFLIIFLIQIKFKLENVAFVLIETVFGLVSMLLGLGLSVGLTVAMAFIMNAADNTMSWHNSVFISVGIYFSLALIGQIGAYHIMQGVTWLICRTKKYQTTSERRKVKISLNSVNLFWAILTIFLTASGFRFGYITMWLQVIAFFTYILTFGLCKIFSRCLPPQAWIFIHLIGNSVAWLFMCYMMLQILLLFIPITAKAFYDNPDIIIALIIVLWSLLCFSYFIPLTRLVPRRGVFYSFLSAFFIICLILSFTSIGFPYSDNKDAPRLQRFRAVHHSRTLYNPDGNIIHSDGNIAVQTWDRNALRTLQETFGSENLKNSVWDDSPTCHLVNCGLTHYNFDENRAVVYSNFNIRNSMQPTEFNLIKSQRNGNRVEVEFTLKLRTLTHLSVTLARGMSMVETSLSTREFTRNDHQHFVSRIAFGKQLNETMTATIMLEGALSSSSVIATIGVCMIDSTFDQSPQTPAYRDFMSRFPDYTFTYVQQADCSSYEIAVRP